MDFQKVSQLLFCCLCFPFWMFSLETFVVNRQDFPEQRPQADSISVGIVLGAGVIRNRIPTIVLARRLDAALELYQRGLINKILVSGSNQVREYNEPQVMKNYLLSKGVTASSIVMDFGGRRTFDTCWRAKNVFKVSRAYLITQAFHLPRATFLCRSLGLQINPITAKDIQSRFLSISLGNLFREIPASWKALLDIWLQKEPPIKGNGEEENLSCLVCNL